MLYTTMQLLIQQHSYATEYLSTGIDVITT